MENTIYTHYTRKNDTYSICTYTLLLVIGVITY